MTSVARARRGARGRRRLLLCGLFALAGCATRPARAPADLAGRLALRVEGPGAARSFSADFDLQGDARAGTLRLSGPLGAMLAEARWQPDGAELTTPERMERFASLDAMAEALLGEAVPLAALIEWLRGRPWTGATATAGAGGFEQLGWTVDLSRHAEGWLTATRPARAAGPAVQVRVRLDGNA
ncbi:MAG TPA: lipoprotein insertase outer membrane protein LolB [Burkholderiaceae bacterium]|nr:lipoprotein insertase outer membrane protein LolB [Burkholderiaceae bacterium]